MSQNIKLKSSLKKYLGLNAPPEEVEDTPQKQTVSLNVLGKIYDLEDRFFEGLKLLNNEIKKQTNGLFHAPSDEISQKTMDLINKIVDEKLRDVSIETEDLYTSKSKTKDGYTLENKEKLVEVLEGKGSIDQILVEAATNNFSVWIKVDGTVYLDKHYSYFSDLSDYLDNISAFQDNSKYYLSIRHTMFKKGFRIDIISDDSTVFNHILVKYRVRDELLG